MKKHYLFTLIALIGFVWVGCKTSKLAKADKQTSPTLLYKIEGKGIQPSYLFGTVHVLPKSEFELKPKVTTAFEASDLIALEIDMDDPGLQAKMMQSAMMNDGTTLDQLFTKEEYQLLDEKLKGLIGVGVEPLNKMKPFMLGSMLIQEFVGTEPASFEGTFVEMAKAGEKEIVGLETVEYQLGIFDRIPYENQAKEVVKMLGAKEEMQALFTEMVETYRSEDIEKLYQMFTQYYEASGNADDIELLLHERNQNWIPRIGELAKEQKVFFGVGSGHLGGELGVVNLLKEAGYTVTPVL